MWRPPFLRLRSDSLSSTSPSIPPIPPPGPPTPPYRPTVSDEDEERELAHRVRALSDGNLSRHPSVNMSLNFVGSPGFEAAPAGQARHSATGHAPAGRRSRTHSLAGSVDQRLSVIDEDHPSPPLPSPPPTHQGTSHRPFHRRFGLGEPPKYSRGASPPRYAFWDVTGPNGEKFEDLRNNAFVAKRGGWKRTCLILWVILVSIIALAVGLGVGLSRRNNDRHAHLQTRGIVALTPHKLFHRCCTLRLIQSSDRSVPRRLSHIHYLPLHHLHQLHL